MNSRDIAAFELWVLEGELPAELKQLATQCDGLAGADTQVGKAVPQPDGCDSTTAIPYGRTQLLEAAGKILDVEPLERSHNAALGLEEEVGNPGGRREGNMALGKMKQQVTYTPKSKPGIQPAAFGTEAFECLERGVQVDS
jgi:hypothetical protein